MKKNIEFKKIILASILIFNLSAFSQAPPYLWSFGMGSTNTDNGIAVCSDASGNVYTMGVFSGTVDFNPGPGVANLSSMPPTSGPTESIYVAKYDAMGNYIWAKSFGNDVAIYGGGMCVDNNGNVIVNGGFQLAVDFDPGPGIFNISGNGTFVLKLDNNGNFVWAKSAGNANNIGYAYGFGLTLDNAGNIYSC